MFSVNTYTYFNDMYYYQRGIGPIFLHWQWIVQNLLQEQNKCHFNQNINFKNCSFVQTTILVPLTFLSLSEQSFGKLLVSKLNEDIHICYQIEVN